MKTDFIPAWTLPELLIVMILSGLIFLALLDATYFVRYFISDLTERWVRTEENLAACNQLGELLNQTDSIAEQDIGLRLYCRDTPLAMLQVSDDSLLCCVYKDRKDTLLRCVEKITLHEDTLILQFTFPQGKLRYRWNIHRTVWP